MTQKELNMMTKDERSLLLYLETRATDYGGRVDTRHMNEDDMTLAKKWNDEKFILFGRIAIRFHNSQGTHWCKLSDEAWILAHQERKARALRMFELRKDWLSTEDSKQMYGDPHFSGMNGDSDDS